MSLIQGTPYPVFSVNYDYIPTSPERQKVLFVTLQFPPSDLRPGDLVKIISLNHNLAIPNTLFTIDDIEGTRISLISNNYQPLQHSGHWGNATRNWNAFPVDYHNHVYGYGDPVAILIH